jgi:hypothetical protein
MFGFMPGLVTEFSNLVKRDPPTSKIADHKFPGKHNGSDQASFLKTICQGGLLTLISRALETLERRRRRLGNPPYPCPLCAPRTGLTP